jgi:hypothetical protein
MQRCTCGKYQQEFGIREVLTTADASFHCFDGHSCLDVRAVIDQCANWVAPFPRPGHLQGLDRPNGRPIGQLDHGAALVASP